MNYLLQSFFNGIGGIIRWLFFRIINILFDKNYRNDLDYYLDIENLVKDKNGFTNLQKNFIAGIFVFVVLIVIAERIES
jgi:hypothetical protein